MNKDDLVSLSYEQKVKFGAAIDYGYFDYFEDNPREWRHSFVGTFLWRYPKRTATLNRLRDILGRNPEWEDITNDLLQDFVFDSLDEGLASSSVRTMCAELKAVLNANKAKVPSDDYARILSVKENVSQAVYLTREEMMRILDYTPKSDIERYVKRNFVVEMLTGARLCDAERLSLNNCDIDTNMLSYVPKKTPGIVVTVPIDERMKLRNYLADEYRRSCGVDVFNTIIRRICRQCRIDAMCTISRRGRDCTGEKWQFVSSHTARRSFATNLYLAGISIEDVAVLMGHGKNIETTKRYICAERKMSSNVLAYFQQEDSL
jgi:integrase